MDHLRVDGVLELPALRQARVLAGGAHLSRAVRWVAVTEWPVEDFVSDGDLVLTTGMGCDEEQLCLLVEQMAAAGAAAICFSTGRGAPQAELPASMVATAERLGVPLVELPWRVRFSDVSRAIVQVLYAEGLPVEFTQALLGSGGVTGIAEALEEVIASPVVILDAGLLVLGAGPLGTAWVSDRDREECLVEAVLRRTPSKVVAAPVKVRDSTLGWVTAVPSADADRETVARALEHAGTAAAIELLRGIAHEEAESAARADFVWKLASGEIDSPHEGAVLLGLPLNAGFRLALGLIDPDGPDLPPGEPARRLRRRFVHRTSTVAVNENLLLVCAHESERGWKELLADLDGATWGTARGVHPLHRLPYAMAEARAALAATRALRGPGSIGQPAELGAYLLLQPLTGDPMAVALAGDELAPLESGPELLETLRVFLEEKGNISSAARRLYLNRHSLIYRLHKIEQLTGRDLASHEDRLVLDLCMRIRRLRAVW